MFERVLVANRGEIAVRVIRACRERGIETVLAASAADMDTLGARLADRTVCIGPPPAAQSYLRAGTLVHAAHATGCDALHPGYGFLSESPELAQACADEGVVFIGPAHETLRLFGHKAAAREAAREAGLPVLPGFRVTDPALAAERAAEVGLPLLIKATHGGGGKGIQIVHDAAELEQACARAAREAEAAFGDGSLDVERYVAHARHVEVQVLGDGEGAVRHLGERECSLQLGYQKLLEEAPCAALSPERRAAICDAAVRLLAAADYRGLATVEFLLDAERDEFWFLEVNPRVQVEHPVTEAVTGVDLVGTQLEIASGAGLRLPADAARARGHALECRLTAQSPRNGLRPSPGRITAWGAPDLGGVRVDTHCFAGYLVPPYYDALLAKVIVAAADRPAAIDLMRRALTDFVVEGIETNLPVQLALLDDPDFAAGDVTTRWFEETFLRQRWNQCTPKHS
jgi:acetyl-CoA carboxylase, biotin carboxylase subunit